MSKFVVYYRLNSSFVNHRREIIWLHTKQPISYAEAVQLATRFRSTGYDAYIMIAEDGAPVFDTVKERANA